MMYLTYALCFLLSFALNLFLWITADLWALIPAAFKLKNMPGPLWYMQTHDDWVYGHGWPKPDVPESFVKRWRIAAWWLRRNPWYAFDALVLGIKTTAPWYVRWDGGNAIAPVEDGQYYTIETPSFRGFGYRRDWYLTSSVYIKIWLGWHFEPKGGSNRLMLKAAFGPKFKE